MPKTISNTKTTVLNDLHDLQNVDVNAIKKQARESAQDLRQFAGKINNLAHEFIAIANDEFSDASRKVRTQIKSEPFKATAVAFAAGFLIRSLLKR